MADMTVEKMQIARADAMAETEIRSGRMTLEQREGFRLGFIAGALYGIEIAKEINREARSGQD